VFTRPSRVHEIFVGRERQRARRIAHSVDHALPRSRGTPVAPPEALIAQLPKVELHCHIEGTMRPGTVADLAATHGLSLPVEDPTELYRYGNLEEFLAVFWLVQSTLVDSEAWARLAYESIVDGAAHGLVHRETFFTPGRHLVAGQTLADIVAGLDEGLALAERETGVTARLIFDIDRDFGPEVALEHVEQLVAVLDDGSAGADRIVGMGMDSTELGIDPSAFVEAYRLGAAHGLHLTAHQGESSPAAAAAIAVDVLGVERLDHGFSVMEDPALVARLAQRRLPFTVCPNANVRINPDRFADISEHPFHAMRDAGLLVTLNTDDPALIDLDLTQEYRLTAEAFDYSFDDLVELSMNGVEACWLDEGEKAALRRRVLDRSGAVTPP
jgi:adenosine deaminase